MAPSSLLISYSTGADGEGKARALSDGAVRCLPAPAWENDVSQEQPLVERRLARKLTTESSASDDSTSTTTTVDLALPGAGGAKLSLAAGKGSSLLQRRGRKTSTLSLPDAKQTYREALVGEGYEVGSVIGRSRANRGFTVVAASKAGRSFAAKVTDECAGTGVFATTLRREFDVLGRLSHPGLVRAEALVDALGGCAMVMELCPGVCLEQLMPQGSALCSCGRHAVLEQILDAVAYLHSQEVAHRDLHALNIMVDVHSMGGESGTPSVKIVDFGSAKQGALGSACDFSELEDLTAEILPPGGAAGASALDSDVFAVGLLAAGLLVGRPMLTSHVLLSAEVLVPEGFVVLSSDGRQHLHSMLAFESRPTAGDCRASLPPCGQWLA